MPQQRCPVQLWQQIIVEDDNVYSTGRLFFFFSCSPTQGGQRSARATKLHPGAGEASVCGSRTLDAVDGLLQVNDHVMI